MITYFFFFFLMIFFDYSFTMHNSNPKVISLLKKIKKIDPHASKEKYQELFYELQQNNLSIEECVELLLERKKDKALNLIKKNGYLNDENISTLKEFYEKLQNSESEKNIKLVIHISPDIFLSQEEKNEIITLFSDDYHVKTKIAKPIYNFQKLNKNSDISQIDGTSCQRKFKESSESNRLIITPGSCHVYVGTDFEESSDKRRKAMLLHEKYHLKRNHDIFEKCLDTFVQENMHYKNPTLILPAYFNYQNFSRVLEEEADRLAAISDDVTTSSYFIEAIEIDPEEETDRSAKYAKHPRTRKRSEWFLRLYKLKEAEEEAPTLEAFTLHAKNHQLTRSAMKPTLFA